MSASVEDGTDRLRMESGRTRDIDEIGRLTVEHQTEVIVDARAFEQAHRELTPLGNRILNRDDADVLARDPSGQVTLRGNFAKTGNCAAQLHIQVRARSSNSRSYLSGSEVRGNSTSRWTPTFSYSATVRCTSAPGTGEKTVMSIFLKSRPASPQSLLSFSSSGFICSGESRIGPHPSPIATVSRIARSLPRPIPPAPIMIGGYGFCAGLG